MENSPLLELQEAETQHWPAHVALPCDESLEIYRRIAKGFSVTHEKRILPRDLKPASIKITPKTKVLGLDRRINQGGR